MMGGLVVKPEDRYSLSAQFRQPSLFPAINGRSDLPCTPLPGAHPAASRNVADKSTH